MSSAGAVSDYSNLLPCVPYYHYSNVCPIFESPKCQEEPSVSSAGPASDYSNLLPCVPYLRALSARRSLGVSSAGPASDYSNLLPCFSYLRALSARRSLVCPLLVLLLIILIYYHVSHI